MEYIYLIIYSTVLVSTLIYIWYDLNKMKIDFKDKKIYITLVSLVAISIFNYFFIDKFVKIILITIIFMQFYKYLFNESMQKCIITPIFYQIVIMISETIFVIFATLLFGNSANAIIESCFGTLTANIIIAIISVIIFKLKFVKNIYYKVINFTESLKVNRLFVFSLSILVVANILAVATYYKFDFKYVLIVNAIITFGCSIVLYLLFRAQNKYNKVYDKYNIAMSSLKEYENMMSKYRIANHENKNLLLTIRAMIVNKETNIPKYIDSMIEEKYEDDEKLLYKVSKIPMGGLRANIYTEILKLERERINYSLTVDKKISAVDLIELDNRDIIDLCKIVGVFIDNAIEAVAELKNKSVSIAIYIENNKICIKVSNNYKGLIDVNRIYEKGYSTKGEEHGYGLSLVKEIVNKNKKLENNLELSKKYFSQLISIEYKKTR